MKPYKWIWVLLIAAIILVGCARQAETPPGSAPVEESTSQPAPTPLPVGGTVVADGELASPYPSLALGFEVSGEVLTITVKPGDAVQAGDVLALLDETELPRRG